MADLNKSMDDRPPRGTIGVEAEYDDPSVGRNWHHDEDEEEESNTQKSNENITLLKSLMNRVEETLLFKYNSAEVEFMKEVMGLSEDDIRKGGRITGFNRSKFHSWSLDRLNKSVDSLLKV